MATMIAHGEEATTGRGMQGQPTPARLTTTLYDLMIAIQEVADPEDDRLVVATVVYLLRSGRITWRRPASASPGALRREAGRTLLPSAISGSEGRGRAVPATEEDRA